MQIPHLGQAGGMVCAVEVNIGDALQLIYFRINGQNGTSANICCRKCTNVADSLVAEVLLNIKVGTIVYFSIAVCHKPTTANAIYT